MASCVLDILSAAYREHVLDLGSWILSSPFGEYLSVTNLPFYLGMNDIVLAAEDGGIVLAFELWGFFGVLARFRCNGSRVFEYGRITYRLGVNQKCNTYKLCGNGVATKGASTLGTNR
ncbi:hypothetical protein EAF00_005955 [Botryotinia globosa]|nr:hypothetical protein EAF00_005955 [Botryotinia globosa]